jgi:glycolate oxidase
MYKKINYQLFERLKNNFGDKNVIYDDKIALSAYACDESYLEPVLPDLVVKPDSNADLKELIKFCSTEKIPLTCRGGGTSVTGASIPLYNGIVLSFENLNRIIEIDEDNFTALVEPGIILNDFQKIIETRGLFYPPDPNSLENCSLGGNVNTNAGGPRAVKYGVTRDYVLNLETITGNGTVLSYEGKYQKVSTGYNFTHLITGSEGTLGVVTKILLRLLKQPKFKVDILVPFRQFKDATKFIPRLLKFNNSISICEFIDIQSVRYSEKFLGKTFQFSNEAEAYLLIEIENDDENNFENDLEIIGNSFIENGAIDVLLADTMQLKNKIWEMRRTLRDALKHIGKNKLGEDVVVPRSKIPQLLDECRAVGEKIGIDVVCYGHTGDGNVHVNVVQNDLSKEKWDKKREEAVRQIFEIAIKLDGTISGEHGIGITKKQYLNLKFSKKEIDLMKEIKKIFDPENIFNPGKIFLI